VFEKRSKRDSNEKGHAAGRRSCPPISEKADKFFDGRLSVAMLKALYPLESNCGTRFPCGGDKVLQRQVLLPPSAAFSIRSQDSPKGFLGNHLRGSANEASISSAEGARGE